MNEKKDNNKVIFIIGGVIFIAFIAFIIFQANFLGKALNLNGQTQENDGGLFAFAPDTGTTPGCPGGAKIPYGIANQTIYCNGTNWVATSNLSNNGETVGVGAMPRDAVRLFIQAQDWGLLINAQGQGIDSIAQSGTGVEGVSVSGGVGVFGKTFDQDAIGVVGQNNGTGTGVEGRSDLGKAVSAQSYMGYGFYQTGSDAKNYFAGRLGIGIPTPAVALDVIGNAKISSLAGTGIAYVCVDESGQLFRSQNPCLP